MSALLSWRPAAIALVAVVASSSLPVPQDRPEQDKPRTETGFVLEAGEHRLSDLLERVSKFLNRNYFWSRVEMDQEQNAIATQKKVVLDAVGCEEVLSQLLYMKGFTVIPIDPGRGMYDVISMRGPRMQDISTHAAQMSPDEVLQRERHKIMVLSNVPLKHLDATRASQQLRPFFASGGGRHGLAFGNAGSGRSLMLQGYSQQVAAAIRLLREMDQPEEPRVPQNAYVQLQQLQSSLHRQSNAMKALQKRVSELESQLSTLGGKAKK